MSFISHRFADAPPEHSEQDSVLLALGLTLVCLADGGLDEEESALLESFRMTLLDWRDLAKSAEFTDAVEETLERLIEAYSAARGDEPFDPFDFAMSACSQLVGIEDPRQRQRCFLLSVDVAMAAGGITETEDRFLQEMANVLDIDEETVDRIAGVLAIKYG